MEDLKISIELVKAVMRDEGSFETIEINKNVLSAFGILGYHIFTINIYEFAFKCKEWAFLQGYELRSGRDIDVKEDLCYFCEYKQERQLDYYNGEYFLAGTEIKAILKVCGWIMNNEKNPK